MCSSTGSRSFRASSGSRSASSSIEPLRSANSTVTCLRSPSRVALEVRIFSARCLGVYASGEGERDAAGVSPAVSGIPHLLQNRDPGGNSVLHEEQIKLSRAPQPRQKFDPGGFTCWQLGHVILESPRARARNRNGGSVASALGAPGSSAKPHPQSPRAEARDRPYPESGPQRNVLRPARLSDQSHCGDAGFGQLSVFG